MRILGMMVTVILVGAGPVFAATVDLSDGRVVQGDIIKQDNKSLEINVDGVTMTYYADEIKDIDGNPFASAPAAPAVEPTPVAQPETTADQGTGNIAAAPAPQPDTTVQPEVTAPAPVAQPAPAADQGTGNTAAPASDGIDPDKRALILKFIDVFGTRQALTNNFDMMLKQIDKEKPDEAAKIRQRVKVDEIIEHLLPIYDRNFTSEDLNAFIAFYGSPEGQKLMSTIPELMKESVQESVKYMEEKFPEVNQGQQ